MKHVHAFVICAYGESPYLEECIRSLKAQSVKTDVLLATPTPCRYIEKLAKKYGIPVFSRDGKSGLKEDWLFALKTAGNGHSLVTLAHQDDRYHRDYVKTLLNAYKKYPDMTVFASDYVVLKTKEARLSDGTLYPVQTRVKAADFVRFVKLILRLPLRAKFLAHLQAVKKSALVFGNSVCCPSCTYNYDLIGDGMFASDLEFALDWDNLYELALRPGRFVIEEKPLIAYRVHDGAATKQCIEDNRRAREEAAMFGKLWPAWAAKILMFFYKGAYGAYGEEQ